ncbi:MAG TPA: hypothetical protein VFW44_21590 [Bryobacteraceae bacterium]|nr:hypothetical protein [Bryobacteraceae bacterium]
MQLASGANTSKSYELGFLLLALTNHRPDFGFEGGAAVLKDNWTIVEEALGPNLVGTRQAYERREQESKAILERHQVRWRGRRNWLVYRMGGSSIGRVSLLLLRYAEIGLILWALYVVSHRGTT